MRLFFIVFSILIFSANTKASCPNINQIHQRTTDLSYSLGELVETVSFNFPRRYNFYEFAVRSESDARFLEFSTQSGLIKCSMTNRIFTQLSLSFNILKNYILRFQRRRPNLYLIYQAQWLDVTEKFNELSMEVNKN